MIMTETKIPFEKMPQRKIDSLKCGETYDSDAVIIHQRGFGIIDAEAKHKKIGTVGLGPCISILGYDEPTKVLTVAHVDTMTELEPSMSTIAAWLRHAGVEDLSKLRVVLDGGDGTSKDLRKRLLELLKQWGISDITDHNPESQATVGSRKFVVSVEDGIPNYNVLPAYPEPSLLRSAKIQRIAPPVRTALSPDYIDIKGQTIGIDN